MSKSLSPAYPGVLGQCAHLGWGRSRIPELLGLPRSRDLDQQVPSTPLPAPEAGGWRLFAITTNVNLPMQSWDKEGKASPSTIRVGGPTQGADCRFLVVKLIFANWQPPLSPCSCLEHDCAAKQTHLETNLHEHEIKPLFSHSRPAPSLPTDLGSSSCHRGGPYTK